MRKASLFIIGIFTVIFVGLVVRNFHQMNAPFYDWDEAIYAQVSREMLQHPGIVTTYNGHPWLEKPPLPFMLFASIFATFGESEFWLRMISVLASTLLLFLLYLLTKKLIPLSKISPLERELIFMSSVLATASSVMFLDRSVVVNVDIFLALGWIGYLTFRTNPVAKGFFLAIGVFAKSLLGFYPVLFDLFNLQTLRKTLVITLIPFAWYLYSYFRFGNEFIQIHFIDHLLKRVTTPLELHFGGKFFYLNLLWSDYHWFLLLFVIGYVCILFDLYKQRKNFTNYLILLSALPFLAFLTIGKSKLSWYIIPTIPLMALTIPYLFSKIKQKQLRVIGYIIVGGFFLIQFIPHTFGTTIASGEPEKVTLARCLSHANTPIAFLVDEDERKIQNTLEAAHLQLETSFDYGGTPAFVYYVNRPVQFFYKTDVFIKNVLQYTTVVLSKKDFSGMQKAVESYQQSCITTNWVAITK